MAETEKFELKVSMNATVTVFNDAGQPVEWLRPGTEAAHTWYGMPTVQEVLMRYQDMAEITSATLKDVLVSAHKMVLETKGD
jgi:hypothetical protein